MKFRYYKVHHLTLASTLDLPELRETHEHTADVIIQEGPIPDFITGAESRRGVLFEDKISYEHAGDHIVFTIAGVGRVLVERGQAIVIDKDPETTDEALRLYLLGTCLGFILLQRGVFPFHGSTVHTPYGTAMFIGESGEGKSTIAAKFLKEGHRVLTDDVCVITLDETGLPVAHPSSRRIKLWEDSLQQLGYSPQASTAIMPGWDKRQVWVEDQFDVSPSLLKAIYRLWPDEVDQITLELLSNVEKLQTLMSNTFRPIGIEILDLYKPHFLFCSALAQNIPIKRLKRPVESFAIEDLYQAVVADMQAISRFAPVPEYP